MATVLAAYEDVVGDNPARRLSGLHNFVVFGRAVTNVLQSLRSSKDDFEEWYRPRVIEMQADPLLRYLYSLRSEILKKGADRTSTSVKIKSFSFPIDMAQFGPPPANASGFFIGDRNGGSGWEVKLPDGSVAVYYAELPEGIGAVDVLLSDAPTQHLGRALADRRVQTICAA
jgi:hypothetical protein